LNVIVTHLKTRDSALILRRIAVALKSRWPQMPQGSQVLKS
jgi:hypothetical protein